MPIVFGGGMESVNLPQDTGELKVLVDTVMKHQVMI
jgi:hypothetical protein